MVFLDVSASLSLKLHNKSLYSVSLVTAHRAVNFLREPSHRSPSCYFPLRASSPLTEPFTSVGFEGECCNFIWVLLSPNLDSHTSSDLRRSDTATYLFRCNFTTHLPWLILLHLSVSQCMFLKYH
ncbi:hypothetical protein ACE6H2_022903 [Prunus campanulata]